MHSQPFLGFYAPPGFYQEAHKGQTDDDEVSIVVFEKMRYRINCIIYSCLVVLVLLVIVFNVLEIRQLRRSLDNRLKETATTLTSNPTDLHVIPTKTRIAWVYPENVRTNM